MRRESALTDGTLTIGLMAKYWESGKVKTRLGSSIGMRRAAQLHRLFVGQLCSTLNHSGDRRSISLSPMDRQEDVQSMLDALLEENHWTIIDQGGGDLGDRIMNWFAKTLPTAVSRSILMGTDLPTIRPEVIDRAYRLLTDHDVVLGPAHDGGYYLIGLRGQWSVLSHVYESLFRGIPWSTPQVLEMTRGRAEDARLSVAELEPGSDIDTIVELEDLIVQLDEQDLDLKRSIERILTDPQWMDRT